MSSKSPTGQFLVVEADWNDADYITQVTPITDELLDKFQPLFQKLKAAGTTHHNWPVDDYDTSKIVELYGPLAAAFHENYVPTYYEMGCVHTIESIKLMNWEMDIL